METQYLVKKVETCPMCKGKKFFYNPEWAEMNERYNALADSMTHEEASTKWDQMVQERWPLGEPPEEFPCGECEAEGKTVTWVSLTEALTDLGSCQSGHE